MKVDYTRFKNFLANNLCHVQTAIKNVSCVLIGTSVIAIVQLVPQQRGIGTIKNPSPPQEAVFSKKTRKKIRKMVHQLYREAVKNTSPPKTPYRTSLQITAVLKTNLINEKPPVLRLGLTWEPFQKYLEQDIFTKELGGGNTLSIGVNGPMTLYYTTKTFSRSATLNEFLNRDWVTPVSPNKRWVLSANELHGVYKEHDLQQRKPQLLSLYEQYLLKKYEDLELHIAKLEVDKARLVSIRADLVLEQQLDPIPEIEGEITQVEQKLQTAKQKLGAINQEQIESIRAINGSLDPDDSQDSILPVNNTYKQLTNAMYITGHAVYLKYSSTYGLFNIRIKL